MLVDTATLKKAILLFDELHFMDRPAFTFSGFGTIGAESPLRRLESKFREDGVPLYVHGPPDGPVAGTLLEEIKLDIDDPLFLNRFQDGLTRSPAFRLNQISPGNYVPFGNEQNVADKLIGIDITEELKSYGGRASDLFSDDKIRVFDLSTPLGCTKELVVKAAFCSAKLNFALKISADRGFLPLADAKPFGYLLGAKYARAIDRLGTASNKIQATDLTFAIFDELISPERLKKLTFEQVIRYRKASEKAREEFLEYLRTLQAKQASIGIDGDYAGVIEKLVATEVVPAAQIFKNRLDTIGDSMFGAVVKGAVGFLGRKLLRYECLWRLILGEDRCSCGSRWGLLGENKH